MDNTKRTTLLDRLKNAARAFMGSPISTLYFGVDVKRCNDCEYRKDKTLRDDLLVTAGTRAAYMEDKDLIELPPGIDGEIELSKFVSRIVDRYLNLLESEWPNDWPNNYDEYIETALEAEYGPKKTEVT